MYHLPEDAEMAGRTTEHQGGKPHCRGASCVACGKRTVFEEFFQHQRTAYKELGLKDKLTTLTEEERIALLSTDGMLVKRPMLIGDGFVLVGFKEDAWEKALL